MSADAARVNTPAAAWAWLTRRLADLDELPGRSAGREWTEFRREKDGRSTKAVALTDWPADFWIAKSQRTYGGQLEAVWAIPEKLDHWPTLEMRGRFPGAPSVARTTNAERFLGLLTGTAPAAAPAGVDPIRRFSELDLASAAHGDQAMISASQVRAWVTTAFGTFLGGLAFTPIDSDATRALLIREVAGRISDIDSFPPDTVPGLLSFTDYGCDNLYNTELTEDGMQLDPARQGQGQEWQHHWRWLSTEQDPAAMSTTLELVGQLLVNEPLHLGLTATLRGGDEKSRRRALCVTRRWLLTAKVLAWLFDAVQHRWATVRPQDLACFAFGALAPTWPRRAVAVSHRSAEVKPILSTLDMWRSPHAAIDASYVPAWETNTGMIWSLFAPVPVIVRVASPAYLESEWCRREHEMSQYLVEHADFLDGRQVVDIRADQLADLDLSLFDDDDTVDERGAARQKPFDAPRREFPPFSLVLMGAVPSGIDLTILRAAGALRLINALVPDAAVTTRLADLVAESADLDVDPPTNNPDAWAPYTEIFRALRALLPPAPAKRSITGRLRRGGGQSLPLTVPATYSEADVAEDLHSAGQIPDLSTGQHRIADVLAALEWRRTALAWFVAEGFGDKVMVDVSELGAEQWSVLPDVSVARGLLATNGRNPTWIVQDAGQNAHLWPGIQDQPIFTRHVAEQFLWAKPVILDQSWLIYYLANSGLDFAPGLQAAMIAQVARSAGPEGLQLTRHGRGAELSVPSPREFFAIPTDALQDVTDLIAWANDRSADQEDPGPPDQR